MATAYSALCTDFYVNQRLSLKMDLPGDRATILGFFDRIRKERPAMARLRRFRGEVALESAEDAEQYEWVSLRRTSIRSGMVNPESLDECAAFHRGILRVAPFYLTISPLDIGFMEVVYGFDIEAERNRNEVIHEALLGDSAFASLVESGEEMVSDCQPTISFVIEQDPQIQATIRILTRVRSNEVRAGQFEAAPISVLCALKRRGALESMEDVPKALESLRRKAERIVDDRLVPRVLVPIREVILSRPE